MRITDALVLLTTLTAGCVEYGEDYEMMGEEEPSADTTEAIRSTAIRIPADATAADRARWAATSAAFERMSAAASRAGHNIQLTGPNSGIRGFAQQAALFAQNCPSARCVNGVRQGTCRIVTACPSRNAPHIRGSAVDLALTSSAYRWLANNARSYSFCRTVSSETWHWEHNRASACLF
ncbi:MAG: M15 family metallopeptidase [Deltaproteobacteria bacterium]|nr:M15 family metallopeptidase [Deltaproteobacteria bacterium]